MAKFVDLTGEKFGYLTVIKRSDNINGKTAWLCKCNCGNELIVKSCNLKKTINMCPSCKESIPKVHKHNSRFKDLTGKTFGKLTVLYEIGFDKRSQTIWHCKCSCGHMCDVSGNQLITGKTQSCGCLKAGPPSVDLTGETFGRLTVLHRSTDKFLPDGTKRAMWTCLCTCGNTIDVYTGDLRTGNTRSCGCLHKDSTSGRNNVNFKDLTGQRFGRLVVHSLLQSNFGNNGRSKVIWHCKCDCGNECNVHSINLIHGHTKSCGCFQHEPSNFEDLSFQTFNRWTVLDDYKIENNKTLWHCKCSCGNLRYVWAASLKNGSSQSCGCLKQEFSRLEQAVTLYLTKKGYLQFIDFEPQKKFNNLTGIGKRSLSYDFVIYQNNQPYCLIECQGKQHYESIDYFGGENQFKIQQLHDQLKREYAQSIHVPLLEIPYTAKTYSDVAYILDSSGIF